MLSNPQIWRFFSHTIDFLLEYDKSHRLESLLKACIIITLLFFVAELTAETKIYKVVRADGSVVFTDKPPPGAKQFEISTKANVVPSIQSPASKTQIAGQDAPVQHIDYDFNITTPTNEQTIRSNTGEVSIEASIFPSYPGVFELVLNGKVHAVGGTPMFNVQDLDRGEYTIKINYLDQTGKLLASTPPSRFYMQKVSALLRAN